MKKNNKRFYVLLILLVLVAAGCGDAEDKTSSGSPAVPETSTDSGPAVEVDLSVPPPGSQATQEKWDSFSDEKRQESWDKYILSLSEGTDAGESSGTEEPSVKPPVSSRPVSVVTALLSTGPMEVYYYGIGEVEAGEILKVIPAVTGTAVKVYVAEGDFVETGDLLFSLDSSEWLREIERSGEKWDAELTLAELRLNEANQELERTQTFFDRDLVTRQELDKTFQAAAEAGLNLDKIRIARETELDSLQENYSSRLGVSPGRGYVASVSFQEGETVNSSDFVEIVNLEEVQLNIEVPENIIPKIDKGAPVYAKTASAARFGMDGVVTGHGILPENNRTYQVRASLINKNQRLFPGMLMEVQIQISRLQPRFIVPRQSVVSEGSDDFIFLVQENVGIKVPVELGTGRQGLVQVDGNFPEEAVLVIEGQSYLKNGSPVLVTETREYLPERTEL